MINGIINVYKEEGFTSNDVIAKMRGILRQRRIGHTGTLDPAAVGVLPVLLGHATKISEYMMDHKKTYRAVMALGVVTDTQDLTGKILETSPSSHLSREQILEAVLSFEGGYYQIPPMYSAKQIGGKRLYDLAREGKVVERKPVFVGIDAINVESTDLLPEHKPFAEVTFTVDCSKGTYIRTLCHDIGRKLGCGASLAQLTRTRIGGFYISDAVTLGQMEDMVLQGTIMSKVIPVEEMFLDKFRASTVSDEADRKLQNGNFLLTEEIGLPKRGAGDLIRVCTQDGNFLGVYRFCLEQSAYYPYKMFLES